MLVYLMIMASAESRECPRKSRSSIQKHFFSQQKFQNTNLWGRRNKMIAFSDNFVTNSFSQMISCLRFPVQ